MLRVVVVGVLGVLGCKADVAGSGGGNRGACVAGSTLACNCPGAPTLMTSCLADGSGYQPCTCPGVAGMGASGSTANPGSGGQPAPGSGGTSAVPSGTGGNGPMSPAAGSGGVPAGAGGAISMMMAGTGGNSSGSSSGSGGMGAAGGTGGATGSTDDAETSMLRDACVAEINMYRATLTDAPPLVRATAAQEMCSDQGAQVDGDAMVAHGFFRMSGSCIRSVGLSAQDTCPGWQVGGGFGGNATVLDALKSCLKQMWAEGDPPEGRDACTADVNGCFQQHGHYLNMSNPKATAASCAFYQMKDGASWWMNQDFVVKWP